MQTNIADIDAIEHLPLGAGLTEAQAKAIFALGEDAVVFALLKLAQMTADPNPNKTSALACDDPACPSGQKPVFIKPNIKDLHRHKKPGCKKGHKGSRRGQPTRIDRIVKHRILCCPDCGGPVSKGSRSRKRIIEDIPATASVETVQHEIDSGWCSTCRKMVEPLVTDALPKSSIGNGILVLCAWLHFALGNTISQILEVFNFHLQFTMSAGGLVQMWHRLADILVAWYEEILEDIQKAGVLHGDETGWRVNGKTHWLWCFTSRRATIFTVERSRAGPVVLEFIKECFNGVFVSDFWYAYAVLSCTKQKCLVHLLRDLERVWKSKDSSGDWPRFCKKLKRLVRDAIRLRKRRDELEDAVYRQRCERMEKRLSLMIAAKWSNGEARRLVKRLTRHQSELFTFLSHPEVPFDNNFGERSIRGAVIMRKNSYNNRSERGAKTQSILMSVFFTIKQRGLNPVDTVKSALRRYLETGQLPKLAEFDAPLG
jgi:transposase